MHVRVNAQQALYVVPSGQGVSTLGFEYVFRQLKQLVARLNLPILVREDEKGTVGQYADYQRAIGEARKANIKETWFHLSTPIEVRRILERYRITGNPIRIFYGNRDTGQDWLEENDVLGIVSRSEGILKVPILLESLAALQGSALLDHCVVKLVDVTSRRVVWTHPRYRCPAFQIVADPSDERCYAVLVHERLHARFSSYAKAAQWVAFMAGECMENPS